MYLENRILKNLFKEREYAEVNPNGETEADLPKDRDIRGHAKHRNVKHGKPRKEPKTESGTLSADSVE